MWDPVCQPVPDRHLYHSRVFEDGLEDELLFRPLRRGPGHFVLAETVQTILDLVLAGVGFSILSRWAVPDDLTDMVCLPLTDPGARVTWSLASREHEKSPATLALRDTLRQRLVPAAK